MNFSAKMRHIAKLRYLTARILIVNTWNKKPKTEKNDVTT